MLLIDFFVKEKKGIKVVIQKRGQQAFRVTKVPWPIQEPTCGGIFYMHLLSCVLKINFKIIIACKTCY